MQALQTFRAADPVDAKLWDVLIERLPPERRDIHFTSAYGRVQEQGGGEALLLAYQPAPELFIVQPVIKRATPYDAMHFDLCSPYGYGGPVCNLDPSHLAHSYGKHLRQWCAANRIVSEFCYLHPLMLDHQLALLGDQPIEIHKDVIIIDLETMSEHTIARRVRRGCKKARSLGATVMRAHGGFAEELFKELYLRSMDLKGASQRWRFSDDYINAHYRELAAQLFVAHSFDALGERMLMVIGDYGIAYAHLLGSNGEHMHDGLDELLYCETARILREQGCKWFHLGGGTTRLPGDRLLAFKSGFAPDRYKLASYSRVFDERAYSELNNMKRDEEIAQLGRESMSTRFPIYRRDTA